MGKAAATLQLVIMAWCAVACARFGAFAQPVRSLHKIEHEVEHAGQAGEQVTRSARGVSPGIAGVSDLPWRRGANLGDRLHKIKNR
jgi:hypothetical protein